MMIMKAHFKILWTKFRNVSNISKKQRSDVNEIVLRCICKRKFVRTKLLMKDAPMEADKNRNKKNKLKLSNLPNKKISSWFLSISLTLKVKKHQSKIGKQSFGNGMNQFE